VELQRENLALMQLFSTTILIKVSEEIKINSERLLRASQINKLYFFSILFLIYWS
jgi:hypothetical protein